MATSIDFKSALTSVDSSDKIMIFRGLASNPTEAGNYTVQQLLEYLDDQLNGMVAGYLDQIKTQREEIDSLHNEIQNMSNYLFVQDGKVYINDGT